ncbi:MAG: hypothetical protein ACPGVU_17900 [Limisphaerales bacterium]
MDADEQGTFASAADLLGKLHRWLSEPAASNGSNLEEIGLRTIVMLYLTNPEHVEAWGRNQVEISNRLGMTKQAFNRHLRSFRKRFPEFHSPALRPDSERLRMSIAMKQSHARRKASA